MWQRETSVRDLWELAGNNQLAAAVVVVIIAVVADVEMNERRDTSCDTEATE